MTLAEFLLARISEDEADANRQTYGRPIPADSWGPDRVLAECQAKRRIVTMDESYEDAYVTAVRALAAVHADHPDYRGEWRP